MIKAPLYTARAHTTGGRAGGNSTTDDGRLSVSLDTPKAMGGDDGPGTNPEQLFAAGYSACFLGALKVVARKEKITIPDEASVESAVSFGENAKGAGFNIAVELKVAVPGMDRAQAEELVNKAHEVCPYSNATRGNIDVHLTVA